MLTAPEGRVLGALVEKELTTPQGYPLTDNALLTACNQTTSRDPVVSYDVATLRVAVRSLREQGLLRTVHRTGERSDKHRHELPTALDLSREQVVVLAVLLLRGPQTAAEVRARSERMHAFAAVEDVERALAEFADRSEPLAVRLERQPGRKEARWAQLLAEGGTAGRTSAGPPAAPEAPAEPVGQVAERVLRSLSDAFRARDVAAALAVFADDAVVLAPGDHEVAAGHDAIRDRLHGAFARPETLGWHTADVTVGWQSGVLWFLASGDLVLEGEREQRLPLHVSGVVVERNGRRVLAQLHGSRPLRG